MLNKKFKLNDYALLVIGNEIINEDFELISTLNETYYFNNDYVNAIKSGNKFVRYTNDSPVLQNLPAVVCKLYFSSELDINAIGAYLNIKENSLNHHNVIISKLIHFHNLQPVKSLNYEHTIYTTFVNITLPYNELINSNWNYFIEPGYILEDEIHTDFDDILTGLRVDQNYQPLLTNIIYDPIINFNVLINENKFLELTPTCSYLNKTIEEYLQEKYNQDSLLLDIDLFYDVTIANQSNNIKKIRISNIFDIYNSLKFMIDTSDIVNDISDFPLRINIEMNIKFNNFNIKRSKEIQYSYDLKNPNEILNNLDIENLVSTRLHKETKIQNQTIIQTPDDVDPQLKVVEMPQPIVVNKLKENTKITDFTGNVSFKVFNYIELPLENNDYKFEMVINQQIIVGKRFKNNIVFNVDGYKYNVNDEYQIYVTNKLIGNTQIILTGKIE